MLQTKIGNIYHSMTVSEKQIADYLLKNAASTKTMTSYDLAQNSNVGQATVIRFTKKLGYMSFRELLADIYVQDETEKDLDDIRSSESITQTNKKIMSRYYEILALTEEYNPAEVFKECIDLLSKAQRILCVGVGHSNYFAQYLAAQLITSGMSARSYTDFHLVFSETLILDPSDVMIVFSESGESREVVYAAKQAKERGIKVIAVTKAVQNTLRKYADVSLNTVNYEVRSMTRSTTMRCSQLCVIDMLLLNFIKTDFDFFKEKAEEGRNMIDTVFPKIA